VDIAYLRLSGWTHPQLVASDAGESILCHEGLRRVFPMNWGGVVHTAGMRTVQAVQLLRRNFDATIIEPNL